MTTWLHGQRLDAVHDAVKASGARTVLDLGCGEGDLLVRLARDPEVSRIVGIDLCRDQLIRLRHRLKTGAGPVRAEVDLIHGDLSAGGERLTGFDCAILIETIEHIDPARLSVIERAVFGRMRPRHVVITTPNAEFNSLLGVPPHRFRHPDHRFEWDRARFAKWSTGVASRNGYQVASRDIAGRHPSRGGASQMAVFRLSEAAMDRAVA
ncbi:methyltransferase domain-containing protein [Lutibaculum baratangense]|uniref:Small RNA 2'-O-methyltransferase n=1 Tax=Lutibaculum baratangense AMV1 TaxID=631454 RepID=V4RQP4_9HYPH|nr:methyltransferase domain-containing protein [Lutibaculum baratangense]ESR25445.1 hypothetical protein N177_1740 [Lutibaculum baratangense AMV1]